MFKKLLALTALAGLFLSTSAEVPQAGHAVAYNNAEALKMGLPLVPRRGRATRSFTAAKRQQSPLPMTTTLLFDDADFDQTSGPIPQPYNGVNLGCQHSGCGYLSEATYPAWSANSSPNAMYFYWYAPPTFTNGILGGRLRIKSFYCAQGSGASSPLTLVGTINGVTAFTETVACTPNSSNEANEPPILNSYNNLPLVDSIQVKTTSTDVASWAFDDMTFTMTS